jgi:hypothetical protein
MRWTISSRISFGYSTTSKTLAMISSPPGGLRLGGEEHFLAAVVGVYDVLAEGHQVANSGGKAVGSQRGAQVVDRIGDALDVLQQGRVVFVDPGQLRLVDSNGVEKTAVAVGGVAGAVDEGASLILAASRSSTNSSFLR